MFETIESGKYPSWTVYVQTMTPEQAENFRYNIMDLTKVRLGLSSFQEEVLAQIFLSSC
jgi:catalase